MPREHFGGVIIKVKLKNNILIFLLNINRFFYRYLARNFFYCELHIWECFEYICDMLLILIFRINIVVALIEENFYPYFFYNDVRASYHLELFAVHKGKEFFLIINLDFQITNIMQVPIYKHSSQFFDINLIIDFQH